MKEIIITSFLSLIITCSIQSQNVGIGTPSPQTSAQLEVSSTSKGFLPPRMTISQRDAILTPIPGLVVWCNNCVAPSGELQIYNGTNWTNTLGGITTSGTVKPCTQAWVVKNLDVVRYRNGDLIPKVEDPVAWAALTTGAYCYYNNDSATYAATYGKLYNWFAINDARGLAPSGWHIPSDAEWTTLTDCLGGTAVAGGAIKETGTTHWTSPNVGATNSSGITGLPGGARSSSGSFSSINTNSYWWSSSEQNSTTGICRSLQNSSAGSFRLFFPKQSGFSIRCIRD